MMNYIWAGMIFLSIVFSFVTGNTQEVSQGLISGADEAIKLLLSILGVLCFWSGIMEIAKRARITDMLAKFFAPVLSPLYPGVDKKSEAMHYISLNISANLLGLGNAATPFGIQAMKELQKLNPIKDRASDAQLVFVVMNTASLQLLPTTLCAYRATFGSKEPFEILPCVWICSATALLVGIIIAKVLCTDERKMR